MDKIPDDKKFFVGELTFQTDISTFDNFVLVDCETREQAERKLYDYASNFMADKDELDEGEGTYSFCSGNLIINAFVLDTKMTINEYIAYKGGQMILI